MKARGSSRVRGNQKLPHKLNNYGAVPGRHGKAGRNCMEVSFDVKLTAKDLFRFNIYQTYTTSQGPISILLAILVFVMAGVSFRGGQTGYGLLYIVVGVVFLIYIPVTLWTRANQTIRKNAVLSGTLHYHISENGIKVEQDGDSGVLEWKQVYKIVSNKKHVLIYSNRVNAYIVPREQLGEQYGALKELADKMLEKYRVRMR